MENLNIPQLLKFDLEKVLGFIEDSGRFYQQPDEFIDFQKKDVIEKVIPSLNLLLYNKGLNGLKADLAKEISYYESVLNEWSVEWVKMNFNPKMKDAQKNIFISKFMMDIYKHILEENSENEEKEKNKERIKTKDSFHWQGSAGELTELFNKMIASKLIAKNTFEADFKAIFEGKPLDEIKPIRWMQTKVLLAYFIHKLSISNNKISATDNHWKIAESCFEDAKNLKQSNQNWQDYSKPKNHHLIDELF